MPYDNNLADRVREHLSELKEFKIVEKRMFGGLAFMVNDKMCINVSDDRLMCRFDPEMTEQLSEKKGFEPMIMNGKQLDGYCYIDPIGYKSKAEFEFWMNVCLDYNDKAVSSKRRKK